MVDPTKNARNMIRPATALKRTSRRKRWLIHWKTVSQSTASPIWLIVWIGMLSSHQIFKDPTTFLLHLLLTIALLLVCYYFWNKQTPTRGRYIPLLFNEAVVLRHYLSPGLESRFNCSNPKEDLPYILKHLRHRVYQMVLVNPWLCGYLKTNYGIPSIWIDELSVDRLFSEICVDNPSDMERVLTQQTSVEVGAKILNTNKPFVKICIVYSPKCYDYYVTVCVTHMVGEPNLLYQLWGMLAPNAPTVPLWADRHHSYKKHPLTALKGAARGKFLYFFLRSQGSIFRTLCFGHQLSQDQPQPIMHRRYVDMEWVQKQKEAYQRRLAEHKNDGSPSYVSTQDILTTWFFSQLKPSCVCVAYSLHDRAEHVTMQHMGNYLEALVLFPEEYSNPGNVRRAVVTAGEWAPAGNRSGRGDDDSAGLVTGWHSRHVDLELPRSTRQTHLPLRGAMFTGMIPRVLPCMCLFRTSRDQFAVVTLSQEELLDTSAFGDPVNV
ncbi:hypothetical protein FisN_7Lh365 [Fistulifera solaris]|uniref:Uncharacterized protein n=1 Tax=Fistulifera solaris TaxID=1519565 RepID=A0A1Z5JBA3_FISSO|nr:hypothetical protein FisN_7Lh365 [Fistulifera solaris]|eukprot:GAX11267.1 hypothetical protein FisN_7Lh365 [Fistulifera solaris]